MSTVLCEKSTLDEALDDLRDLVPAAEAAKVVKVGVAATVRWHLVGVKARDGERKKLWMVRVGGRWMTTMAALRAFIESTSGMSAIAPTSAQESIRKGADRAAVELISAGL